MFGLRVRDVDCDFRLLRRSIFDRVQLEKNSGVICLEMMKKIQDAGFAIVEVPVHHYHRAHGKSQFFNFPPRDSARASTCSSCGSRSSCDRRIEAAERCHRRGVAPQARGCACCDAVVSGVLSRPPRDDHGRPRLHRQQHRPPPRRARSGRAVDGLAHSRIGREFLQHRRHRRQSPREHRRRPPGKHDEPPRPRSRGHLQPRRPGEPHRQHEGSVHGSGNQLPQPALDSRGMPEVQSGGEGGVCGNAPGVRQARLAAGHRRVTSCGRSTSTASTRRPARTTICSTTTCSTCAPARCGSPTCTGRGSSSSTIARDSSAGSYASRSRVARSRSSATAHRFGISCTSTTRRTRSFAPARRTRATARSSTSADRSRSSHKDLVALLIDVAGAGSRALRAMAGRKKGHRHRQLLRRFVPVPQRGRLGAARAAARRLCADARLLPRARGANTSTTRRPHHRPSHERVEIPFVDLHLAEESADVREAIERVIDRAWFVLGPEVEAFEQEFAAASRRAARGRRRQRHRRARADPSSARHRPRRRSHHDAALGRLHGDRDCDGGRSPGVCRHRS